MKTRLAWLAGGLLLGFLVAVGWQRETRGGGEAEASAECAPCLAPDPPVVVREDGIDVLRGGEFERAYGVAGGSAAEDLRVIRAVLADARLLIKEFDRLPLADNRDFAALLSGSNSHRFAWIPPDHPALGPGGELLDRWGTPVIFHRLSAQVTELRSAGPDRTPWTGDDILLDGASPGWDSPAPNRPGRPAPVTPAAPPGR